MSDPFASSSRERCSCGAEFTFSGMDIFRIEAVEDWRLNHRHETTSRVGAADGGRDE